MATIAIGDLAGVVYSAGKVFDGLSASRLDAENFLRSGSIDGVTSRSDLALLQDLRDVAQFGIDHAGEPIDADYVCAVNSQMTRSGALHPGRLRTDDQAIGVRTRFGRHEPPAVSVESLQRIIDRALSTADVLQGVLEIFVDLAKAQPFEDGNKRTALFVANGLLIGSDTDLLLTVPVDEHDPSVADDFNDRLARAYISDGHDGVKDMLRERGFTPLES